MLETFMFWFNFGILWIFMFGFIIYHLFSLVDYYIGTITDGDYPSLLRDKIRNPILIKMGVMGKVDWEGFPRDDEKFRYMFGFEFYRVNNKWPAITLFWLSVIGFALTSVLCFVSFKEDLSFLEEMISISKHMNELNMYTFTALVLLLVHHVLKTLYKSGKSIKNKLDKIE